ncbi:MAG: Crp/Fnr family transcriptional regulator [Deltaproteobacteria bacterium]|nr:Crp/Fnr family transcriptional regulator [Deltaproteobacteria bacterium]
MIQERVRANGAQAHAAAGVAADHFEIPSLRRIDWLRELGSTAIQLLQRSGFPKRYAVGELIFAPTANPESVYLVETGLARVYRVSEAGCETSFGYVAPGEVFGELLAFGDYPRESFAQAVQASLVWRIAREPFQRLMASRPSLVLAIAQQMGERLKRVEARVEDLVFHSVRIRVARMLSELARSFGRRDGDLIVIDIPITQAELATLVGATRQTVNQALGELGKEGLVTRRRQRIVLLQPTALAQLLGPAPEA